TPRGIRPPRPALFGKDGMEGLVGRLWHPPGDARGPMGHRPRGRQPQGHPALANTFEHGLLRDAYGRCTDVPELHAGLVLPRVLPGRPFEPTWTDPPWE